MNKNHFIKTTFRNALAIFLIVNLLIVNKLFAQSDFRPGYYITNQKDTVHGFLNFKGSNRSSRVCIFKDQMESSTLKFNPDDILAYKFENGKYYVSKEFEGEKYFFEYIVNGIADLYFFRLNGNGYYLIEKEKKLYKLEDKNEVRNKDGIDYAVNNKKYVGYLKAVFSDCMEIQPEIENAQLSHKSLKKIVVDYHSYTCDGEKCILYEKEISKIKLNFSPYLGFENSFFRANKALGYNFVFNYATQSSVNVLLKDLGEKVDFSDRTKSPKLGVSISAKNPFISDKLSFELDLTYTRSNYIINYVQEDAYKTSYLDLDYNASLINIGGQIRYSFPKGKIRPVFGLGGGSHLILNSDVKIHKKIVRYYDLEGDSEVKELAIPKGDPFLSGSIGFNFYFNGENYLMANCYYTYSKYFRNTGIKVGFGF